MQVSTDEKAAIVCSRCGHQLRGSFGTHCPIDGAMLAPEVRGLLATRPTMMPFGERFRDVLLMADSQCCREKESLRSPLLDASSFGKRFGIQNLTFKDETCLPTGTTKARMAAGALGFLFESNVSHFVVTSTGNSTTAMARLMSEYPEMKMTAFAGKEFVGRHEFLDIPNIELFPVNGDFVSAEAAAKRFAKENDVVWEGGFFNPARRIALSTAYLEACDEIGDAPHWYFQSVSSGMGVVGVGELSAAQTRLGATSWRPRLVAVQQESCAPMVTAFRETSDRIEDRHKIKNPTGIAKAILRGDPTASYPIVRKHVLETGGTIVSVTETDILRAQRLLLDEFNLAVGESAAAALAAALNMGRLGKIAANEIVLVNLTGRT